MTGSLKTELLDLERSYWRAMKAKDIEALNALTEFPCVVAGAQGVASLSEQQMSGMMSAAPWTLKEFQISDNADVRQLSDDVAIVAYKVHEELTVEGKPVALDAADTSVWVRRDGRWLCALHTESLAGDPFGRDRARQ